MNNVRMRSPSYLLVLIIVHAGLCLSIVNNAKKKKRIVQTPQRRHSQIIRVHRKKKVHVIGKTGAVKTMNKGRLGWTAQAFQHRTVTLANAIHRHEFVSQPREARVMSLQRRLRAEMRRRSGLPGVVSLSSMYLLVRRWLITSMILGTISLISLSWL